MSINSRRSFVKAAICGCAFTVLGSRAWSRVLPQDIAPLITNDYSPVAQDERGLWQGFEKLEERISNSNRLIKDPELTRYLTNIVLALTDGITTGIRVYPMWEANFNASMAPNGLMIVNSGFLARVRNEAQLAAILGHECGHYLRQHSIRKWRSARRKAAVGAFVSAGSNVASGVTGTNWYDLANSINENLLLSIFQYSRDLESEADAYGLQLLIKRGYPPRAAAEVWSQLIAEDKASAAAARRRYREQRSAFDTHPPSSDRMKDLTETAELHRNRAEDADERRSPFLAATRVLRPRLIEEQVKLNDPGASLYLINSLAQDGWDGVLRFYEGEVYRLRGEQGDHERSVSAYAAAVDLPDVPAEAYRAHGYALLKMGMYDDGKNALRRYLELMPQATDAEMVRFTLKQ